MSNVRLTRRLTLEEAQQAPDGAGGYARIWVALGQIWADIRPAAGRERDGQDITLSASPLTITVRAAPYGAPSRPKPDQRFREGNRLYRITAVQDRGPDARYLICNAIEEQVV